VTIETAKRIAYKLFNSFDVNKSGAIESQEASSMIKHAYQSLNKNYVPNDEDCQDFIKTQDKDKDGKLTLIDIEKTCINFLCASSLDMVTSGGSGIMESIKRSVADQDPYVGMEKSYLKQPRVSYDITSNQIYKGSGAKLNHTVGKMGSVNKFV